MNIPDLINIFVNGGLALAALKLGHELKNIMTRHEEKLDQHGERIGRIEIILMEKE